MPLGNCSDFSVMLLPSNVYIPYSQEMKSSALNSADKVDALLMTTLHNNPSKEMA